MPIQERIKQTRRGRPIHLLPLLAVAVKRCKDGKTRPVDESGPGLTGDCLKLLDDHFLRQFAIVICSHQEQRRRWLLAVPLAEYAPVEVVENDPDFLYKGLDPPPPHITRLRRCLPVFRLFCQLYLPLQLLDLGSKRFVFGHSFTHLPFGKEDCRMGPVEFFGNLGQWH